MQDADKQAKRLIDCIRSQSGSDHVTVTNQLVTLDIKNVVSLVADEWLAADEGYRRALIVPLIQGLVSRSASRRELAAYDLLQIGHFALPYIDEFLRAVPESLIIQHLRREIEILDLRSIDLSTKSPMVAQDIGKPDLLEEILLAVRRIIVFGNDTVWSEPPPEQKLIAYIEINADVWARARADLRAKARSHIAYLGSRLGSDNVDMRRIVTQTLRAIGGHQSLVVLIQALYDSDVFVRDEAVLAFALTDDLDLAASFLVAFGQAVPASP